MECFRGKADVKLLLRDVDSLSDIADDDDHDRYFHVAKYDPYQKTLEFEYHESMASAQFFLYPFLSAITLIIFVFQEQ